MSVTIYNLWQSSLVTHSPMLHPLGSTWCSKPEHLNCWMVTVWSPHNLCNSPCAQATLQSSYVSSLSTIDTHLPNICIQVWKRRILFQDSCFHWWVEASDHPIVDDLSVDIPALVLPTSFNNPLGVQYKVDNQILAANFNQMI